MLHLSYKCKPTQDRNINVASSAADSGMVSQRSLRLEILDITMVSFRGGIIYVVVELEGLMSLILLQNVRNMCISLLESESTLGDCVRIIFQIKIETSLEAARSEKDNVW